MKVSVFLERSGESKSLILKAGATVADALKALGVTEETVIVARNGELAAGCVALEDNDKLKIMSVVSGG